jgi:(p)ppGpp synthase/HD superfamily hydrolase
LTTRWRTQRQFTLARCAKGTRIPYVSHLLAVTSLVLEHGGTEHEAIGALLHDAAEDQGGKRQLKEIEQRFGKTVRDIVAACSDTFKEPKPAWRKRKQRYITHISRTSSSARLVSAADKLHNARATLADYRRLGEPLWARFNAKRDDQLWYYEELVRAFRKAGDHEVLVGELDVVVSELRLAIAANRHGA